MISNFTSIIAERSGIETRLAEPFRNIKIPKKFDKTNLEEIAPMMAVAVGLALRKQGDR
jgi:type IV pilus assembly protein PilM